MRLRCVMGRIRRPRLGLWLAPNGGGFCDKQDCERPTSTGSASRSSTIGRGRRRRSSSSTVTSPPRASWTRPASPVPRRRVYQHERRRANRHERPARPPRAASCLAPPAPSRKGRPRGVVSAGSCRTLPKRATTFYDRFPTPGKKGARRSCRGGHDDCDVFILDRSRSTAGSHACPHGVSGGCRGRARGLT
jgi:hypothetical protein